MLFYVKNISDYNFSQFLFECKHRFVFFYESESMAFRCITVLIIVTLSKTLPMSESAICLFYFFRFLLTHRVLNVPKQVLELRSGATQSEIKNQCRTLAVKYHPDKAKDEATKKEVQNRFFEVQQACELLSNSRAKRRRRNKQYNDEL